MNIESKEAEIKKQDLIFDTINQERKRIGEQPYAKTGSKAVELRDYIFEDYEVISSQLKEIEKEQNEGTYSPNYDERTGLQKEWKGKPKETTFKSFIEKLHEKKWVPKECLVKWKEILMDNFNDSLEGCGSNKLIFCREINYQQNYLWYI